jgi:hypothetical protein
MTPEERETFIFNIWEIDWENFFCEYFTQRLNMWVLKIAFICLIAVYCLGLRTYICQEDMSTLSAAKKKYKLMLAAHYLMLSALIYIFARFFLWVVFN